MAKASTPRARRHKHFTYTVKAQREMSFPVDMLRYDTCWPSTGDQAVLLTSVIIPERSRLKGIVRITLTGTQRPTSARWKSFGWDVVGEVVEREVEIET